MPGLYPFFNPLAESDRNIALFYNTERNNLALTLKASAGSDPGLIYSAQSTNQPGVLVEKTELDSTIANGLRLIVGLTVPASETKPNSGNGGCKGGCGCGTDPTDYDVSIISPMYMPIAKATTKSNAIASCSDGTTTWLWYITGESDNNRRLTFTKVMQDDTTTVSDNIPAIVSGTSLVSIYSTFDESPLVFYQGPDEGKGNRIYEYNQDSDSAAPIEGTSNAGSGTTMALGYQEEGNVLFLYFTDKNNRVQRIHRKMEGNKKQTAWSPSRPVHAITQSISPDCQLGVVTVQSQKLNHIFYIPNGSPARKFSHAKDPWAEN